MDSHRLLFVCTANICRSPMAEALALLAAEQRHWNIEARSCGVEALTGQPAAPNSVRAIREVGGDLSGHVAQPMSDELAVWAHRILVMEIRHSSAIRARFPMADEKIQLLGHFGGVMEVGDPYGSWIFTYRRSRDLIRKCVDGLLDSMAPRPRRS
jgi:protein-tyrosine-phosphatase